MRLLITGASGAIGRHATHLALQKGAIVHGIGHGPWANVPPNDRLHWLNAQISGENLDTLFDGWAYPDVVVHLAGGSHVGRSIENPGEDFKRTVVGTQALLEWLRTRTPSTRLVLTSSAAVYGNPCTSPITESMELAPTSPYGAHKAMAESLVRLYANQYNVQAVIIRLFSVYGPLLRKQIVWELTSKIFQGKKVFTLGGTGRELRDFLYIEDAAQMLLHAATLHPTGLEIVNGAHGTATQIMEIISKLKQRFPKVKFVFSGEQRVGDPTSLTADISRARELGFSSTTTLTKGLELTIEWISTQEAKNI